MSSRRRFWGTRRSLSEKLKARLMQAVTLTRDLASHLGESSLALDLPGLPSNQISGQMWCIVGARESYATAMKAGSWQGFSCSLDTPHVKESLLGALDATRRRLDELDLSAFTDQQVDLAFALLEHEVQHHGQLIRYIYANGLTFPRSWNERYTV